MRAHSREHTQIFRKCAARLIPFILVVYCVNYLDRVNVGFAALTMNRDIGLSPAMFGFGAGVFFLGYFLFQVPGNVIMHRLGARSWMFFIMLVWGIVSAANAFVQDPISFYALRFFLGIAEAGFFPGMLFYLTCWFPQEYLARMTSSFMIGIPLAFVIGGPISSLILQMDGMAGLHGWQWLFIIEGLPACVLAFIALAVLPDNPVRAPWLTPDEKNTLTTLLQAQTPQAEQDVKTVLFDPRVLALGLVLLGSQFGLYGVQLWLPQIVQSMGFSVAATGMVAALPFIASIGAMVAWARSSDIRGERIWHIGAAALMAALGLVVAGVAQNPLAVLAGLTLTLIGTLSVPGPLFSLPSSFLSGTAAAGAIALVNAMGTLGRFLGPTVVGVFKQESETYASAMLALALGLVMSSMVILSVRRAIGPQFSQAR